MMQFSSALSADFYVATEAILLYRQDGGDGKGFATVHEVEMRGDVPVVNAGKLLGTEDMAALMMQIMPSRRIKFIEQRLLGISEHDMVWWTPPAKKMIWFNTNGVDGLGQMCGQAWQPGLVFAAGECGWRVYAVKGLDRPARDTQLFQSPHYNVNAQGQVCRGSVDLPEGVGEELIEDYERAFFGSRFTHPNIHVKRDLTKYKGGAAELWKHVMGAKTRKFPEASLVSLRLTVGGLIDSIAGRYT
jgi:PRTRC genetic system protein B